MCQQPAGQDDLLLVAAGEGFDRRIRRGGLDIERLDVLVRKGLRFGPGDGVVHSLHHLQREDDVVPHGEVGDDAVPLAVLGQVADAVLHGVERFTDLHMLSVDTDRTARGGIGAEDGAHALAAGEILSLVVVHAVLSRGRRVFLDDRQILQILADHLLHQLHLRQVPDRIFADELAVAQDGDLIADRVDLLEKMRDKDDAHASGLQVPHQREEHFDFLVVQRRGRLIQDQDLALGVYRAGDGDHLLNGERAAAQLLSGPGGDPEAVEKLAGAFLHRLPVDASALAAADEHVLRHGEVRAERDLLVHGADAVALRLLRGVDDDGMIDPFDPDLARIHGVHAGQDFDQRRFARAVFPHQRVNRSFAQGKIHVFQRFHARKILADPAHGQNNFVLHPFSSSVTSVCKEKARCGPRISPLLHTALFANVLFAG